MALSGAQHLQHVLPGAIGRLGPHLDEAVDRSGPLGPWCGQQNDELWPRDSRGSHGVCTETISDNRTGFLGQTVTL